MRPIIYAKGHTCVASIPPPISSNEILSGLSDKHPVSCHVNPLIVTRLLPVTLLTLKNT